MNTISVVIASVVSVIALIVLLILIFGNTPVKGHRFKGYFLASAGVYLSGTIMVLIFTLSMPLLPVTFVIISELTIAFVFIFTTVILFKMSNQIVELHQAILDSGNKDESQKDS